MEDNYEVTDVAEETTETTEVAETNEYDSDATALEKLARFAVKHPVETLVGGAAIVTGTVKAVGGLCDLAGKPITKGVDKLGQWSYNKIRAIQDSQAEKKAEREAEKERKKAEREANYQKVKAEKEGNKK